MDQFVDRRADLKRLEECFSQKEGSQRRKIVILHGPAGIGKSRLSTEFVRLYQHKYSHVFWLNGVSEATLKESIASIASRIPAGQSRLMTEPHNEWLLKVETVYKKVLQWLAADDNDSWLLIFDDVCRDTDITRRNAKEFDVEPYLPRANHGHILMTTRLSRFAKHGITVKLNPFDDDQTRTLLARNLETFLEDTADMRKLIKLVGGHPLAIVQAGAFIRKTSLSISNYVALFQSTWAILMELNNVDLSQKDYTEMCVLTTWTIAYEKIKKDDEATATFLKLWASLENSDIWFELFSPESPLPMEAESLIWFKALVSHKQKFDEVLEGLLDYSMIETAENSVAYSMPAIFHDFASRTIRNQDENEIAWLAVVIVGRVYQPKKDWENLGLQRRLIPHANYCYRWIVNGLAEAYFKGPAPTVAKGVQLVSALIYLSAIHKMGKLYHGQGKLTEAKNLVRRVVEGYGEILGQENPATLNVLDELATISAQEGNNTEAREMYLTILEGRKKAPDADQASMLETFRKLGEIYAEQDEMAEAEKVYLCALRGYDEMEVPGHPLSLLVVAQLGEIYEAQGRLDEAEEIYLRMLALYKSTERSDHTILLDAITRLSVLYMTQDKLSRAEKLCLNATEGYATLLGPEHKVTLATIARLGIIYKAQENFGQAEITFRRALQGYENSLGPDNPSTLTIASELIDLYSCQDKRDKSQEMVRFVLRELENSRGPDHESTIHFVTVLGVLCSIQGQLGEAEELLLRALPILQRNKSPEYVTILKSVYNLAIMYKHDGKLAEAERTALVVLQGYEQALGSHHKDTLDTAAMIGHLYQKRDLLVQAEKLFLRALHGYDQILGEEHESTLELTASLAGVYQEQDKHAEAEKLFLRAFRGYNHKLGSDHFNTANAAYNLATVCTMQGKFIEAEKMYRQATTVYMATLGPNHKFTTDAIHNLASVLNHNGKLAEAEDLLLASLKDKNNADGTDDVFVCDAMINLGTVYLGQGKLMEAEDMYLQALKGYEKSLSPNNMATLNALCRLGALHIHQNKLSEASVMYLRALKGYEGLLGSDIMSMFSTAGEPETRPSAEERPVNTMRGLVQISEEGRSLSEGPNFGCTTTLKALRDLVALHFERRELSEAESLCFRLLEETEKTLGSENPCTIETADMLSSILLDQCRRNCVKKDVSSIADDIGDEVEGLLPHKSICRLTKLSEKYGKSKTNIYGDLGRALLHLGDYLNATAAFKNQHSLNKRESIICDHCANPLASKTGRYVCETCRDADLCEACWNSWLDEEWQSMTCEGHIYFQVFLGNSLDDSGTAANASSLASWMHSLKCTCED